MLVVLGPLQILPLSLLFDKFECEEDCACLAPLQWLNWLQIHFGCFRVEAFLGGCLHRFGFTQFISSSSSCLPQRHFVCAFICIVPFHLYCAAYNVQFLEQFAHAHIRYATCSYAIHENHMHTLNCAW